MVSRIVVALVGLAVAVLQCADAFTLISGGSGSEYCYISNHDDKIYLNNVCARPEVDGTCFQTIESPAQQVQGTAPVQRDYVFPTPVPNLDTVIVRSCNASLNFVIQCDRLPLCVIPHIASANQFRYLPPVVFNAPPRAVCVLRNDAYNEHGYVVNNTVTDFSKSYRFNPPFPGEIDVEFYTDRNCSPNAFIPSSAIPCFVASFGTSSAFGCAGRPMSG